MKVAPRYDGPPIISISGPPDDQLVPVVRQRRRMEAMLGALSDDEWATPSRCEGWTIQDVVAHVVGVNAFWEASVRAGAAGDPTRILTGFDPAATPRLMVAPMRELAPSEVLAQFAASNDGFLDAIGELDDAGWMQRAETPAGHVPIRLLAHHALWDCWIHERDVALPLGSTPTAEPDEVASSLRYVAAVSPALAITTGARFDARLGVEADEPEVTFVLEVGDCVAVRDEAIPPDAVCLRGDAVTLVEALSLRQPLPAAAPTEWRHLLDGLAMVFDVEQQPAG